MVKFLRKSKYVFVWQSYDMLGMDAEVMCHRLHIDTSFKPIKQKPRRSAPEKADAIKEEIQMLLKVGAIREA